MNSLYGMRGVICERFGWTLDYLENKIPWLKVHYMMIDAPKFVPAEKGADGKPINKKETPKTKADQLTAVLSKYNKQ